MSKAIDLRIGALRTYLLISEISGWQSKRREFTIFLKSGQSVVLPLNDHPEIAAQVHEFLTSSLPSGELLEATPKTVPAPKGPKRDRVTYLDDDLSSR